MSQSPDAGDSRQLLLTNRRAALGTLGLGALAFLGSGQRLAAEVTGAGGGQTVFIPSASGGPGQVVQVASVDLSKLPEEWVLKQGKELRMYATYLTACKLKHISPQQVLEAHAKKHGDTWNTLPPRKLWPQLVPTLRVVDRLAAELGEPIAEIVSAYRCPLYNSTCEGAASRSWHQANVALDIKFNISPSTVATTAKSMRTRGIYRGGVGSYDTFTHVDTRGENVEWNG